MRSSRRARALAVARAGGQAGLGALLIGGVVWSGNQPAVLERVAQLDVARAIEEAVVPGTTTVALESAALVCPGPELLGLAGARDAPLDTRATLVAAPLAALGDIPAPVGRGSLALAPLSPAAVADDAADDAEDGAGDDPGAEEEEGAAPVDTPLLTSGLVEINAHLAVGSGVSAPGLVATQETLAETEEVLGLATVACQRATASAWLLGGGGGPGRAERIILSNPGSNPVTVDVTAYGSDGASSPADAQGLVVPPRGRTILLGDALAPEETQPGFRVNATGGEVTAVLAETSLSGAQPTGFDVANAAAEPSREQVIPGVVVPAQGSGTLIVRVLNPGESEVIGTVAALTAAGEQPLPDAVVRVPAGSVVDVPIEGLPAGPITLAVAADAPVVAAARSFVNDRGIDGSWAVSQAALVGPAGAALPASQDLERTLVISARAGAATVDVTQVTGAEVSNREVLVPADGTVTVALGGDGVWLRQLEGAGTVHGAVVSSATNGSTAGISSLPLTVPAVSGRRSEVVPLG